MYINRFGLVNFIRLSVVIFSSLPLSGQWSSIVVDNPQQRRLQSLFFQDENKGFIGGNGIILKTEDAGQTWANVLDLPEIISVETITFPEPAIGIAGGGTFGNGQIWRSSDGGNNWHSVTIPAVARINQIVFVNSTNGYAICNDNGIILRTGDGGLQWTIGRTGRVNERLQSISMVNQLVGYVTADHQSGTDSLLKTVNGGFSWESQATLRSGQVLFTSADTGYLSFPDPAEAGYFKTTDGGDNWSYTVITRNSPTAQLYFVSANEGYAATFNSVWRTTDAGSNWQQELSLGTGDMYFPTATRGYALPPFNVTDSLRMRSSTTAIDDPATALLPGPLILKANFPNPFNPRTTIEYSLSHPGIIELAVYNILGQKVRVLSSGFRQPGSYRTIWDGSRPGGSPAASGIYIYRLRQGGNIVSRKMLLSR